MVDAPVRETEKVVSAASFQLAFFSRSQAGSLRYIGRPSIVRLWKFLHTRARQRRLQTGLWRE
jgi:hypothetical protein